MLDLIGKLVINFYNFLKSFCVSPKRNLSPTERIEKQKIEKQVSKQWLPNFETISFPSAQQTVMKTEEANFIKVKEKLQPCLDKINKLINDNASLGRKEVYLPVTIYSNDDVLKEECIKVMRSAGYTLFQNSMTGQWVIRW